MKVGLVLTNDCNLGCSYCYSPRQKVVIDLKTALEFVDASYLQCNQEDFFDVNIIGGEVFLKPRLVEALFEHVEENYSHHPGGYGFSLTTNATLVQTPPVKRILERFAEKLSVGVSIDGTKEAHDKLRIYHSGRGSWVDSVAGFEYLKTLPLLHLDINATFGEATFNSLVESLCFLSDLTGKLRLTVNPASGWIIPKDRAIELSNRFIEVYKYLNEHHPGKSILGVTMERTDLSQWHTTPITEEVVKANNSFWCRVGQTISTTVGPGGKIYPCNRFQNNDRMQLANLIDGRIVPLPEAEERLVELSKQFSAFPAECRSCALKHQCAYCIAGAYEDTTDHVEWLAVKRHCGWTYAKWLAALWYRNQNGSFYKYPKEYRYDFY